MLGRFGIFFIFRNYLHFLHHCLYTWLLAWCVVYVVVYGVGAKYNSFEKTWFLLKNVLPLQPSRLQAIRKWVICPRPWDKLSHPLGQTVPPTGTLLKVEILVSVVLQDGVAKPQTEAEMDVSNGHLWWTSQGSGLRTEGFRCARFRKRPEQYVWSSTETDEEG